MTTPPNDIRSSEMNPSDGDIRRLLDLLADRATQGLAVADAAELQSLLQKYPQYAAEMHATAAITAMALGQTARSSMPAALRAKLAEQGRRELAASTPATYAIQPRTAKSGGAWLPWAIAAVCALAAVAGWWPRTVAPISLATQYTQLASKPGAVTVKWAPTQDPAAKGMSGEIVWDPSSKSGFVRIRGLAKNDAASNQYQLWIFDKARGDKSPLGAGLFDVASEGEVIVALNASLPVTQAAMFGLTLENAGGSVVPTLEHLVAVAKPTP
jgi:anti-sigma-K factor RskA